MDKKTFDIPENCNATVEQVGNQIVISFEPKVEEFKKGDILYANVHGMGSIVIYEGKIENDRLLVRTCYWYFDDSLDVSTKKYIRVELAHHYKPASTEQRQLLFDKLKEKGYRFNEETCELEKIKWEPDYGDKYEIINIESGITLFENENGNSDSRLIKLGNCFKPGTLDQEKVSRLFAEFIQKVKDEHGINY